MPLAPADERILVLAPAGKNATLIHDVLARSGMQSEHCLGVSDVCRLMLEDVGTLIVAEEAFSRAGADELVAALDKQPAWSAIPVLIITGGGRTTPMSAMLAKLLG